MSAFKKWLALNELRKALVVDILGMFAVLWVTAFVYLKTNQPLIIVIGGLVMVAAVLGSVMR